MGTEAEIQDALELFGRTCFEVLKVEVSTYSVEEDPLRIEFCSNSGDLWYMLPLRETTIDPGYALLRMVAEAGYSLPSSQRMNLCHAGNDLHACLERLKAREAKADQTAAHVALGYTGLTFNNDQRSLSEAVRDAEAERLTVASAAHPGGVAAWSTGQSAVSAGGSLGPSVLDYLDPYASHRHLQRMSERGPGIAATIRENHVKILRREMDRKLVVMATQDDTWGGENP